MVDCNHIVDVGAALRRQEINPAYIGQAIAAFAEVVRKGPSLSAETMVRVVGVLTRRAIFTMRLTSGTSGRRKCARCWSMGAPKAVPSRYCFAVRS